MSKILIVYDEADIQRGIYTSLIAAEDRLNLIWLEKAYYNPAMKNNTYYAGRIEQHEVNCDNSIIAYNLYNWDDRNELMLAEEDPDWEDMEKDDKLQEIFQNLLTNLKECDII